MVRSIVISIFLRYRNPPGGFGGIWGGGGGEEEEVEEAINLSWVWVSMKSWVLDPTTDPHLSTYLFMIIQQRSGLTIISDMLLRWWQQYLYQRRKLSIAVE